MRSAIETLESLPCPGRKIAVLGDMRELGDHADNLHAQIGQFIAKHPPDLLVCVGEKAQLIAKKACEEGIPPSKIRVYADTLAAVKTFYAGAITAGGWQVAGSKDRPDEAEWKLVKGTSTVAIELDAKRAGGVDISIERRDR